MQTSLSPDIPVIDQASFFSHFPESHEAIVQLWEYEWKLKVTRMWDTLRFRLHDSLSLTEINLQLTLQIPHYKPFAFNQSFAWATIDEGSGIDIRMNNSFLPRDEDDLIFIYLATVFGSYIWHGERMEMNCLSIVMSLKGTGIIDNHLKVKRFIEICKMNGVNFQEVSTPERLVQRETRRVDAVIAPPSQPRVTEAPLSWLSASTWKPSQVVVAVIEATWVQTESLVGQTQAQLRDPSQWIELFIHGLEGKSPTRAIKLLENAIARKQFGEEGTTRLQRLLDERNHKALQASDSAGNHAPNPKEFIDTLTGSLGDQIWQLERQIKRWRKYGNAYINTLTNHKTSLESRLAGKK